MPSVGEGVARSGIGRGSREDPGLEASNRAGRSAVTEGLVHADRLSFVYDPRTPFAQEAVTEVDLRVAGGEVVALIGPTASGKSTLLQLLARILPPTSGRLILAGSVAMAFQRPEDLLFCATVQEDVESGAAFQGLEGFPLRRRVETAMAIVGLDEHHFLRRSSLELSLGEQRRVALAAILALEPQLLLLDEPGAGLDGEGRRLIMAGIRKWIREDGRRSLIFSTHDMQEAASSDRVLLMAGGQLLADAPPVDVLGRPALLSSAGLEPPLSARVALALGCPEPVPIDGASLAAWLTASAGKRGIAG